MVAASIRDRHPFVRSLLYHFSAKEKLRKRLRTAKQLVLPLLIDKMAAREKENKLESVDVVQWMVDTAEGKDRTPERLLQKLMFLCLASIHTSSTTACQALFDLCAYPDFIDPLREEITLCMERAGGLTMAAINKMWKLDSFLKESQRINHPGSRTFLLPRLTSSLAPAPKLWNCCG